MNKVQLGEQLEDLGIETNNYHPKSTFVYDSDICVGLYGREMKDDFFFYNNFDKKIYVWRHTDKEYELDGNTDKYIIPLTDCKMIWEDKPYVELKDEKFSSMTLRQYACIHLRIPHSGLEWLDNIIRQTTPL